MRYHIAGLIQGLGIHTTAIDAAGRMSAELQYRQWLPRKWIVENVIVRTTEEWERHLADGEFLKDLQGLELAQANELAKSKQSTER